MKVVYVGFDGLDAVSAALAAAHGQTHPGAVTESDLTFLAASDAGKSAQILTLLVDTTTRRVKEGGTRLVLSTEVNPEQATVLSRITKAGVEFARDVPTLAEFDGTPNAVDLAYWIEQERWPEAAPEPAESDDFLLDLLGDPGDDVPGVGRQPGAQPLSTLAPEINPIPPEERPISDGSRNLGVRPDEPPLPGVRRAPEPVPEPVFQPEPTPEPVAPRSEERLDEEGYLIEEPQEQVAAPAPALPSFPILAKPPVEQERQVAPPVFQAQAPVFEPAAEPTPEPVTPPHVEPLPRPEGSGWVPMGTNSDNDALLDFSPVNPRTGLPDWERLAPEAEAQPNFDDPDVFDAPEPVEPEPAKIATLPEWMQPAQPHPVDSMRMPPAQPVRPFSPEPPTFGRDETPEPVEPPAPIRRPEPARQEPPAQAPSRRALREAEPERHIETIQAPEAQEAPVAPRQFVQQPPSSPEPTTVRPWLPEPEQDDSGMYTEWTADKVDLTPAGRRSVTEVKPPVFSAPSAPFITEPAEGEVPPYKERLSSDDARRQSLGERVVANLGGVGQFKPRTETTGVIYWVTGSHGGCGKTTVTWLAANLMAAAMKREGKLEERPVFLIEADVANSKLAQRLNLNRETHSGTYAELLSSIAERRANSPLGGSIPLDEIKRATIQKTIHTHETGLQVIACPYQLNQVKQTNLNFAIRQLVEYARDQGGYVFVDADTFDLEGTLDASLAKMAHHVIIISDSGHYEDARRTASYLTQPQQRDSVGNAGGLGVDKNRVAIFLNETNYKQKNDVEEDLRPYPVVGFLPVIREISTESAAQDNQSWVGNLKDREILGHVLPAIAKFLNAVNPTNELVPYESSVKSNESKGGLMTRLRRIGRG